eukprot:ANDGO_08172.mRNA.1 hypothetical protein
MSSNAAPPINDASSPYFSVGLSGICYCVVVWSFSLIVKFAMASSTSLEGKKSDFRAFLSADVEGSRVRERMAIPFVPRALMFLTGFDYLFYDQTAGGKPIRASKLSRFQKFAFTLLRSVPSVASFALFLSSFVYVGLAGEFGTSSPFTIFAALVAICAILQMIFYPASLLSFNDIWDLITTPLPTTDASVYCRIRSAYSSYSYMILGYSLLFIASLLCISVTPIDSFQYRLPRAVISLIFIIHLSVSGLMTTLVSKFVDEHVAILTDYFVVSITAKAPHVNTTVSLTKKPLIPIPELIKLFFEFERIMRKTTIPLPFYLGPLLIQFLLILSVLFWYVSVGLYVGNFLLFVDLFGPMFVYAFLLLSCLWPCAVTNSSIHRFIVLLSSVIATDQLSLSIDKKWRLISEMELAESKSSSANLGNISGVAHTNIWTQYTTRICRPEERGSKPSEVATLLSDQDTIALKSFVMHLQIQRPEITILGVRITEGIVLRLAYAIVGIILLVMQRVLGAAITL